MSGIRKIGPRVVPYLEKPMLKANIDAYTSILNEAIVQSEYFAQECVNIHGLKGKITPAFTRSKLMKDMFSPSGSLNKNGRTLTINAMKKGILPVNANMKDFLNTLIEKAMLTRMIEKIVEACKL